MNRAKSRGLLLGELMLVLTGFTLLVGFARALEPSFDRFCVGETAAPNGARPPRAVADLEHLICVAVGREDAAENHYATALTDRRRPRTPSPPSR